MKSIIFGGDNTALSTSATQYNYINAIYTSSWNATQTRREAVMPVAGVLKNFRVNISAAPGTAASGKKYVFNIYKNGSATGITVEILDTATSGSDLVNTATFAAGDTLSIEAVPTGTPTAPGNQWWSLEFDNTTGSKQPILGEDDTAPSTSAANYININGGNVVSWTATETDVQIVVPTAGTLRDLYIKLQTSPGAAKQYDYVVMLNGSPTSLTVNLTNATTGNDTTHTVAVVAGDVISIKCTPTGTPTSSRPAWGLVFEPTTAGEAIYGYGSSIAPSASATNYEQILGMGNNSYTSTESGREEIPGPYILKKFYVKIGTAPGASQTRTFKIRQAGADSGLVVAIADANTTGNDTTNTATFSAGQKSTLRSEITGTPAALTGGVHMGFVIFNSSDTTTTQTILGMARITATTLRTILGKADILKATTQTITGLARITKSVSQTIQGLARITASTSRTITGLARITASTSRTILGKASILRSTAQTITGLARIEKSASQTIQGLARVTASTLRTIQGLARITTTTTRTITGKADILKSTTQTITGLARVEKSVTQTITGLARITASTAQTIAGKARITISTSRTIQGLARITTSTAQTIAGISRITATTARTISGKAAILRTTSQTIDGLARIALITTQDILGKARITASTSRTIQGLARIEKSVAQTISGRARITAQAVQTILGKARIQISTSRTIQGISRITSATVRTIAGKARITATTLQTITGVAVITNGTQRIITGMARITVSVSRTILGRARISVSTTRNILGKASISDTITTRNITGKADIKATTARTITGKAAIGMTTTRTITGMARIVPRPPRRIFNIT